jgi:hypothetical protein
VVDDRAVGGVDPAAGRDAETQDPPARAAQGSDPVRERGQHRGRVARAVLVAALGDDPAAQVEQGDRGVRDGDVRADHGDPVGLDVERHVRAADAGRAGRLGRLADQAAVEQGGDHAADRGRRQPGGPGHRAAGNRPVVEDGAQHRSGRVTRSPRIGRRQVATPGHAPEASPGPGAQPHEVIGR